MHFRQGLCCLCFSSLALVVFDVFGSLRKANKARLEKHGKHKLLQGNYLRLKARIVSTKHFIHNIHIIMQILLIETIDCTIFCFTSCLWTLYVLYASTLFLSFTFNCFLATCHYIVRLLVTLVS
jgi:hypothetical protein